MSVQQIFRIALGTIVLGATFIIGQDTPSSAAAQETTHLGVSTVKIKEAREIWRSRARTLG